MQEPLTAMWAPPEMQVCHYRVGRNAGRNLTRHGRHRSPDDHGSKLFEGISQDRARVVVILNDQNRLLKSIAAPPVGQPARRQR
jgi:hypothetical protein